MACLKIMNAPTLCSKGVKQSWEKFPLQSNASRQGSCYGYFVNSSQPLWSMDGACQRARLRKTRFVRPSGTTRLPSFSEDSLTWILGWKYEVLSIRGHRQELSRSLTHLCRLFDRYLPSQGGYVLPFIHLLFLFHSDFSFSLFLFPLFSVYPPIIFITTTDHFSRQKMDTHY